MLRKWTSYIWEYKLKRRYKDLLNRLVDFEHNKKKQSICAETMKPSNMDAGRPYLYIRYNHFPVLRVSALVYLCPDLCVRVCLIMGYFELRLQLIQFLRTTTLKSGSLVTYFHTNTVFSRAKPRLQTVVRKN